MTLQYNAEKSGPREQVAGRCASGTARYNLDELLAQCDPSAEISEEDRAWLDGKPVGKELL